MNYYDAHNHLQDPQFAGELDAVVETMRGYGVAKSVVNGTCESDWPGVMELATRFPDMVVPACGLHPWQVNERSASWQAMLTEYIDAGAVIGEVGLDRWVDGYDAAAQDDVFRWQLALAAERNLPVTIHCLRAWGRMLEVLRDEPLPARGFLLHSYAGSMEMVPQFVELGGYFSLSGYFAHPRKERAREVFGSVPIERLLIETDAPDMLPPQEFVEQELMAGEEAINHPGNIAAIYRFAAEVRGMSVEELAPQVEKNFVRLFGRQVDPPHARPS